jgi:hypothetical protein
MPTAISHSGVRVTHPHAVLKTAAGREDIAGDRVVNGDHRAGMTVTQCMQDIAISLLKCMQPVNKDQIICGGRINGTKERIAWP